MSGEKKRSHLMGEALEPLMLPGDIVLVLGADDSRTTYYGKDYKEAYADGTLTAKHTVSVVVLGVKLLGELMAFHMKYVMPKKYKELGQVEADQEKFNAALASGTLAPEDTFRMLAESYKQMAVLLDGHIAACAPAEYRRMAEGLKEGLDRPMSMPDRKGEGRNEPS
jgi:hypothetical protein